MKKISDIFKIIFGYGIMISLFVVANYFNRTAHYNTPFINFQYLIVIFIKKFAFFSKKTPFFT